MKYLIKATTILLLLALTLFLVSCNPLDLLALAQQVPLLNGITWSGHRLVLDPADMPPSCDNWVLARTVIRDGDTYKMWFAGRDPVFISRVHYTESTDGLNWNPPVVVIDAGAEGTYDTAGSADPSVLKEDGNYKMWYVGWDGANRSIIYAQSTDGRTWTDHSLALKFGSQGEHDAQDARAPMVIKDGNLYRMWYNGYDGATAGRIIYAESADGIIWTNVQLVIDLGAEGYYDTTWTSNPAVIKDNLLYKMWYQGSNADGRRILYAESSDGITWTDFQLAVDINNVPGKDTNRVTSPSVISDLGVGKMWYAGWDAGDTTWRIFYAESQ